MEYLEDNTDTGQLDNGLYKFKCIKDHRGPYTSSDLQSTSNIIASDPYTCGVYAKKHDLLIAPG